MTLLASPRWHEDAACTGQRRHLFYENSQTEDLDDHHRTQRAAIAVCLGCPVRQTCLDDALTDPPRDQAEVRGGMTADQRRAKLRHLRGQRPSRGVVHLPSGTTGAARSRIDSTDILTLVDQLRDAGHTMTAIAAAGGMLLSSLDSFFYRRPMRVSLATAAGVEQAHAALIDDRKVVGV